MATIIGLPGNTGHQLKSDSVNFEFPKPFPDDSRQPGKGAERKIRETNQTRNGQSQRSKDYAITEWLRKQTGMGPQLGADRIRMD